jgi:hypothetical protein
MYLETVLSQIVNPNFSKRPCNLVAPQIEFSIAILRMSFMVSQGIKGLPGFFLLQIEVQNRLKQSFLQDRRVSGVTRIKDSFQLDNRTENASSLTLSIGEVFSFLNLRL